MMSGTITLANGTVRQAFRDSDGEVIYRIPATNSRGYQERAASLKQAATFVLDGWETDIVKAEAAAHREHSKRFPKPVVSAIITSDNDMDNVTYMAATAMTASARRFWARKAGLALAA